MLKKGDKVRHTTDGSGKVMVITAIADDHENGISFCSWTAPDGSPQSAAFHTFTLVLLPEDSVNYSKDKSE